MNNSTPVTLYEIPRPYSLKKMMKAGDYVQCHMRLSLDADMTQYHRRVYYRRVAKVNDKSFSLVNDVVPEPYRTTKVINMSADKNWANTRFGIYSTGKFVRGEDYFLVRNFNDANEVEYFDI